MGNCSLSSQHGKRSRKSRVILPGGELRQFDSPVKAAELMLDSPNHFVASAGSLQVGRRFSPLPADEELEAGTVYAMFPMRRVNSLATAADVARPWLAGGGGGIPPREAVQGTPEWCRRSPVGTERERRASLEDVEELLVPRLTPSRSRKPSLETITEEAFCPR